MAERHVVRIADVAGFSPPGHEGAFISRMLIDEQSVGSTQLVVNHFTLKAGHSTYEGQHPYPFDEVYCVLQGCAILTLGSDPAVTYRIEPGMIAFIPSETNHGLENPGPDDLVLFTIMPQQPRPGVNSLYDARKHAWGTSFRMVDGAEDVVGTVAE